MITVNSKKWTEYGKKFAQGNLPPVSEDSSLKSYSERVVKANYRLSEAHLASEIQSETELLEQIRTKMARGKLGEARTLIQNTLASPATELNDSLIIDLLTDLTRVEYQEGNWNKSIELITTLLTNPDLSPTTKMTLHQMRTLSFYELQNWSSALNDIENVKAIEMLFPKTQLSVYAEVQRIKILARIQGIQWVENSIERLWSRLSSKAIAPNFDTVLTLLRLQLDMNRLSGRAFSELAYLCYRVADAMGDGLYAGLALVDLAYSEAKPIREEAKGLLPELRKKYKKIDSILSEAESNQPACELTRNLLLTQNSSESDLSLKDEITKIILINPDFFLDLKTVSVEPLSLQQKSKEILSCLAHSALPREELFQECWGLKFKKEQHDIVLRNAILRARKQSLAPIVSEAGNVQLEQTHVSLLFSKPHD